MSTYTAQQLIDRAAAIADMKDGFISPTTWLDWLNDERQSLDLFIAQSGWTPVTTSTSTTLTAASAGITIGTSALAIIGVWEVDTSGRYRQLFSRDIMAQTAQDETTGPIRGPAAYFSVSSVAGDGFHISLFPKPTSGTYLVVYIPQAADITSLATTLSYPMRFEKRIVLGMALAALSAEESDTSKVERAIQKEDSKIEKACWDRMLAMVPAVRNVDMYARGWTQWIIYPPPVNWYWI